MSRKQTCGVEPCLSVHLVVSPPACLYTARPGWCVHHHNTLGQSSMFTCNQYRPAVTTNIEQTEPSGLHRTAWLHSRRNQMARRKLVGSSVFCEINAINHERISRQLDNEMLRSDHLYSDVCTINIMFTAGELQHS